MIVWNYDLLVGFVWFCDLWPVSGRRAFIWLELIAVDEGEIVLRFSEKVVEISTMVNTILWNDTTSEEKQKQINLPKLKTNWIK